MSYFFFPLFEYMLGFETFKQFWICESLLTSKRYQVIFTSTENMENPLNYKIIPLLLLPLSILISFTSHFNCYPFILSVWQQGRIFPGKLRTSSWDINALWHGHPLFTEVLGLQDLRPCQYLRSLFLKRHFSLSTELKIACK